MAMLCLNFYAKAQDNKAIDVTTKGLQIGQQVPNVILTNLHNYKDASGKPAITAKLSDFKGKLLILDFWATWCQPCVAMIPRMESLQKQFGSKMQFLSITYQTEAEVLPFLEKLEKQQKEPFAIPQIVESKELHRLFPHAYLPHYVWIDREGIVKAITSLEEINEKSINAILTGDSNLSVKRDVKINYDNKKPMFINGNGGNGSQLLYHSMLAGYTEGLGGGFSQGSTANKGLRVSCRNLSISELLAIAYGEGLQRFRRNRIVITSTNTRTLTTIGSEKDKTWFYTNAFCYEILTPENLIKKTYKIMQQDLAMFFPQFKAEVEVRSAPVYVLIRTSNIDKVASKNEQTKFIFESDGAKVRNSYMNHVMYMLNGKFMQHSPYYLLDETGYKEKVAFDINADLSSIEAINGELEKYDLKFIKAVRPIEILVISDNN